jgi:hypothetical protein
MRQTDLNISPYFDDNDPAKRFYQILFKAGQTVQSRELNELQDILLNQIESVGTNLFKNGSVVVPGNFVVQTKLLSIGFVSVDASILAATDNLLVRGETTGIEAKVTYISSGTTTYAFCDIVKSGSDNETQDFTIGETLTFYYLDTNEAEVLVETTTLTETGIGSYATVDEGIFFVRGMMVRCEAQEVVLSNTENVSVDVGFTVLEEIITSNEDTDLLSNALGTPNARSPGADRLKLTLTLGFKDTATENPNFLTLATINSGNVVSMLSEVQYNEIMKILAQRTYEESGNYSVNAPSFEIREHLLENDNGGVYDAASGGDESKVVVVVSPAVHYVYGYRIENSTPKFVEMPKSRDTATANNAATASIYGSLVDLQSTLGTPIIDANILYSILDATNAEIGTFRTMSANKQSTNACRLVARDITFNTGKSWSNAVKVTATKNSAVFTGTLVTKGILNGGSPSLILELPYSGIKSLQSSGTTDTNYSFTSDYSVTLNASGVGVVIAPSGTTFLGTFSQFITSLQDGSGGEILPTYTLIGTPVGSSIQIDCGVAYANQDVKAMLLAQKSTSAPRTKKLTTTIESLVVNSTDLTYTLSNPDIVEITLVTQAGVDITSQFTYWDGQTDFSYENGTITSSEALADGTISVEYSYYAHSAGDYFCVDSYTDASYGDIPSYTDSVGNVYDLRDCIDFRKSYNGSQYTVAYIASPSSTLLADIEFYLPRYTSLYVNSDGDFGVALGVSSQTPDLPDLPENAMKLIDFYLPSWTFSTNDILQFSVSNKRYTMKDIGNLEKRIENVEYYTSLSLLEMDANSIQVIDPDTGNDRFKNGILADPFIDFRLVNTDDAETFASIDDQAGRLRPLVDTIGLNMQYVSGGKNLDSMISASTGTAAVFASQPYATRSINVNPYAVFSWAGFISLSPSRDFWVDTIYNRDKIINVTENTRGSAKAGVVYGKWSRLNNGTFRFNTSQSRVATITSFTEWTTSTTSEATVKTELIPYMRSIEIAFSAKGLRPLTRVYPWFSNRNVSAYTKPTNGTYGGSLVTDSAGNVSGVFRVPNTSAMKFSTGTSAFVLCDNATNVSDSNLRSTFANASFQSGGTAVVKQRTTVQTRVLGVTTRTEIEYQEVDPIAQSFTVDHAGGLFLEKIDLFFATKAKSIPVTLEIREMENGLPTHDVIGRVTLNPSQVNTSISANVATTFTFAPAVYLKDGGEYAIVILANTQEYNVYIAQMGEKVINSANTVSTQPHTGVFFTSSNGSTWSPQQLQDLKFKAYRSVFNTAEQTITFKPTQGAQIRSLKSNPLTATSGSAVVEVYTEFHGTQSGDTITLSGLEAGAGFTTAQLNKSHQVTEVVDFNTVKITLTSDATSTGSFGGSSAYSVARNLIDLVNVAADYSVYDGTSIKFEYNYRLAGTRALAGWTEFIPGSDTLVPEEGSLYDTTDFSIRVTIQASSYLSPQLDLHGFCATLSAYYVDQTEELMSMVSRDVYLDNPSTSAKFFISSLLPSGASMKFYMKTLTDVESDWIEINPNSPLLNGSTFVENEYDLPDQSEFIGVRYKVTLTGSRTNPPALKDIRGVILA